MSEGRVANLVVVGVPKAGTGSLFAYLAQHPEICGSDVKETGYFLRHHPGWYPGPPPPVEDYARHWAHSTGERYLLEATPAYCYAGRPVIEAMRQVLGRPKVIMILRDPVERLWSAYTFQHSVGQNAGLTTFAQYLEALEQRPRDGSDLVPGDGLHGLHIGYYADYLPLWLDEYGDDLRVVFMEDLRRDPGGVLSGLYEWLGLDPDAAGTVDLSVRNATRHPRSARLASAARTLKKRTEALHLLPTSVYPHLRSAYFRLNSGRLAERFEPDQRRRVAEIYRESNRATAELLAAHGYQEVPEWLQVGSAV